ncbi:fasciclin-2-like protein [Anaeramoeba ignava]|uniref:Fasciclin-2-like protein n=1 Tax=Anaeramoeba ignava TaxID=1746090 RepID=A0A9Q0LC08_ANAIG|nr:fasciclin-2-like protein [Anaeramoeba ignava]
MMKKLILFLSFILILISISIVEGQLIEHNQISFKEGIQNPSYSFIDKTEGFVYFADSPVDENGDLLTGKLYKLRIDTLDLVSKLDLGIWGVGTGVFDSENHFAYFGSEESPMEICKVDLRTFEVVDFLYFEYNFGVFSTAQIDIENQIAYFGTGYQSEVLKINLTSFEQQDAIAMGAYYSWGSVIDLENELLYLAASISYVDYPTIYKINLTDFTVIDGVNVSNISENALNYGFFGQAKDYLYFSTYDDPCLAIKIDVSNFSVVDSLLVDNYGGCSGAAVNDDENMAYFITNYPAVRKMNLTSFTLSDSYYFNSYDSYASCFDLQSNVAYISLYFGEIVKFNLTEFDAITSTYIADFMYPERILIDEENQYLYLVFTDEDSIIAKIDIPSFSLVDYVVIEEYEIWVGNIDNVNGFAYFFLDDWGLVVITVDLYNLHNIEYNTIYPYGYVYDTVYDPYRNRVYVSYENYSMDYYDYYLLIELSCPDLEILNTVNLGEEVYVEFFLFDYSNGHLYGYIDNYTEDGDYYYLAKIQTPTLEIIDTLNLTDYDISVSRIDEVNQTLYFGTGTGGYEDSDSKQKLGSTDYSQICVIDLIHMQLFYCQEIYGVDYFTNLFIDQKARLGFFFTEFQNEMEEESTTAVIEIDLQTNQMLSNTTLSDYYGSPFGVFDRSNNVYYMTGQGNYPSILTEFLIQIPPLMPQVVVTRCIGLFSEFKCDWIKIQNDEQFEYQIDYGFGWKLIQNPALKNDNLRYQWFNSSLYPNITGNEEYSIQIKVCSVPSNICGNPSSPTYITTRIDAVKDYSLEGYRDYIKVFWDYPDVQIIEEIPNLAYYVICYEQESGEPSEVTVGDPSATSFEIDGLEFGYTYYVSMWACSTEECDYQNRGKRVKSSIPTGFPNVTNFDCFVSDVLLVNCSWSPPPISSSPTFYNFTYQATSKEDSSASYPNSTSQSFRANFQSQNYQVNVSACNLNGFCGSVSTLNISTGRLPPPDISEWISQPEQIEIIFASLYPDISEAYLVSIDNGTNWQQFSSIYPNGNQMVGLISPLQGNVEYLVSIRGCTDSSCQLDYLGLASSSISVTPKLGNISLNCVSVFYGFYCDWEPLALSEGLKGYSFTYNSTSVCLSYLRTSYSVDNLLGGTNYQISVSASADSNCDYNDYSGLSSTMSLTILRFPPPSVNGSVSKIEEIELIFSSSYQNLIKAYLVSIDNGINWENFTSIYSNGNQMVGSVSPLQGNVEYLVSIRGCSDTSCESGYLGFPSSSISVTPKLGNITSLNCSGTVCGFECDWTPLVLSEGLKGYSLTYNSESICLSSSATSYSVGNLLGGANYQISISASADSNCDYNDYSGLSLTTSTTTLHLPAPSVNGSVSKIEEIELIFSKISQAKAYLVSIDNGTNWQQFSSIYPNGNQMVGSVFPLQGNVEYLVSIRGCSDTSCESGYLGFPSSSISVTPKLGNITSLNCSGTVCGFECDWTPLVLSEGLKGYSLTYNSESICLSSSATSYSVGNLLGGANYQISISASADSNCDYNDYSGLSLTTSTTTLHLPAPSVNGSVSKIEEIELIFSSSYQNLIKAYLVSIDNGINWENFTSIYPNGNQMVGSVFPLQGNVEYLVSIRGCSDTSCESGYLGFPSSSISVTPKLGSITSLNCSGTVCGFECDWTPLVLSEGLKGYSLTYNSESICLSAAMTSFTSYNLLGETTYQISISASADWKCSESVYSGLSLSTSITTLPAPVEKANSSSNAKVISISVVVPVVAIAIIIVVIIVVRKSKKH